MQGLTCASCGGSVDIAEGLTNVSCRYCGTPQAVIGRRGVRRMMVLDALPRDDAASRLTSWFTRGIRKDPALKRDAKIDESFLAWFPFIRCRCDIVGWVLGVNTRRRKKGNRWVTEEIPVELQVENPVDMTLAAADMAEFGVGKVDLAGDEVVPLNEDTLRARGMVFRPNRTPDEAASELIDRATHQARSAAEPERVSFSWFSVLRRRVDLVFYPMWVFRYSHKGRTYQALIDAEDGSLAFGKAPGNHLWRAFAVVSACAGAGFIGTTLLQHFGGLLQSENGLIGLGIVGLMLAGFVHWGYSQFRKGGVVEEGTGLIREGDESPIASLTKMSRTLGLD